MVACSYQYELDQHQHQRKVLWHRYSITPADLNAERKKRESTVAGAKMQTARDAAKEHAQRCGIPDHVLALAVEDVSGGLRAYEQEELARVVKQRFKKSEKPTILDLLTVGHRWRGLAKDIAITIAANVQRQSRGDMRIGERLRPCPGCEECRGYDDGIGVIHCDGSGVLPAKSKRRKAHG